MSREDGSEYHEEEKWNCEAHDDDYHGEDHNEEVGAAELGVLPEPDVHVVEAVPEDLRDGHLQESREVDEGAEEHDEKDDNAAGADLGPAGFRVRVS